MSASALTMTLPLPAPARNGRDEARSGLGLGDRLRAWLGGKSLVRLAAGQRAQLERRRPGASRGEVLCLDRLRGTPAARLARLRGMPDASVDTVVSAGALAAADDVEALLAEAKRVLRPGGRLLFVEPVVAAAGSRLRRTQQALAGLWRLVAGTTLGDLWNDLKTARFGRLDFERINLPALGGVPVPHIVGEAHLPPRRHPAAGPAQGRQGPRARRAASPPSPAFALSPAFSHAFFG